MRTRSSVTLVLAAVAAVVATVAVAAQAAGPSINAGPKAGIVWERAQARAARNQSPNLIYHGGPVMTAAAAVTPIFWGTSWPSSAGDKISGVDSFYAGVGGTTYAGTNTEYTDSSARHVSSAASTSSHLLDSSAAPPRAPQTSDILAEVAKMVPSPVANGYYPVYVDTPRGHTGYCAWHSSGTVNGVVVQFAFFFNLDGDPGCDPQDPSTAHSQGLEALANVSGHEFSEMMTDPQLNAWYDSKGAENSDKCAWTFGANPVSFGRTSWKIQGNWSNAAYDGGRGYTDPANGFVRGCIDGTN